MDAVPVPTKAQAAPSALPDGARERERMLSRAGVVGAGTLVSRLLGLCRDVALAALFDVDATDAWWVAFTIPNALRQLLGEGVVSSAVVPILSEKLAKDGEPAARLYFARIRGVSLLALAVAVILGVTFARPLTFLFAGGYRDRPNEFERTVALTRVVFPYIAFMGTAALGMAALNVKKRFAVAAFAPALLNVALLAFAFGLPGVLVSHGVDGVLSLAWGALVGGFLQVAAQWPALRAIRFADRPQLVFDDDVKRTLRKIVPLTAGIGIYAIDLVVSRRFLSDLGPGAQSSFSWAMRLCDFPQGIFVMALSTVSLPSLSMLAAQGARGELVKTWAHGMTLALFVAIPASAAAVVLGEPIVVALLQRGAFHAALAHETARALAFQGSAIWTVAAVRQIIPAFYAVGDTRTPVVVSAIDLVVLIALASALKGPWGPVGVSAAVAGSSFVQMALLLWGLRLRLGRIEGLTLLRSAVRTVLASAAASVAGVSAAYGLAPRAPAGALLRALPGIAGVSAFTGVFVLVAWGLGAPELSAIGAAVRKRRGRSTASR